MGASDGVVKPSTISGRINAERLLLASWPRAVLLQLAHPLIAAGVTDHSTFRDGPVASVQRLHHTVRAMLALVFGGDEEQDEAVRRIQAIHRRVNGSLREATGRYPAGTRYSAEDPALLLWVHATLLESAVIVYDALVKPVSTAERDAYCRETAGVAVALGALPGDIPRDWLALERYMASVHASGVLTVGADARALAPVVLGGELPLAGPVAWAMRTMTAAWLPAEMRAQYGIELGERQVRRARHLMLVIRLGRRLLPDIVAHWPEARGLAENAVLPPGRSATIPLSDRARQDDSREGRASRA